MDKKNEKFEWFNSRFQFIVFIVILVTNILWSYFTVYKQVEFNTYRIQEIEKDRTIRWAKYDECLEDRNLLLKAIGEDIAVIKVKLESIENIVK